MISSGKKGKLLGLPLYQIPFHHITKGKFIRKILVDNFQPIPERDALPAQNTKEERSKADHSGPFVHSTDLDDRKPLLAVQDLKRNVRTLEIPVENGSDVGGWSEDDLDIGDSASPENLTITSALSLENLAEQFSVDVREKRREQEVKNYLAKKRLDASSFETDEHYRYASFLESAKTLDILDWNEVMLISSYFHVDKAIVRSL